MSSSPSSERRSRRRRPRTLRATLVLSVLGVLTLACGAIAVTTEVALSNYLIGQLDDQLHSARNQVNGGVRPLPQTQDDPWAVLPGLADPTTGPQPTRPPFGIEAPPGCTTGTGLVSTVAPPFGLFQPGVALGTLSVWVHDGQVLRAGVLTGPQRCEEPDAADLDVLLGLPADGGPVTVRIGERGEYRVQATEFRAGEVSITGLPLTEVRNTQLRLGVIMGVVILVALLGAAVVVYILVRRQLRPLEQVATTARQVATMPLHEGEVDLGIRVPDRYTDPDTEVGQVGSALNQMLGHVGDALSARQASEMQVRQFVADASHELRTPLASIRGYSELARRDEADPETVTHALRRVEAESQRMSSLVDDLLLLARLDSGRPLSAETVDLTMLVVDTVSDAQVAGPGHIWQLDLPEEPVEVRGDPARLHQVLANLLSNARTHTPAGTIVRTGLRAGSDAAVLTVQDNGPGIDPALQPGIFDRFVRGDSSRSRQAGSTGLGLAIVKAVVTAHRGTVAVDSAPGRTVFTVRLPIG